MAAGVLLAGLFFSHYPLGNMLVGVSAIYLFICIFFRKYEDVQQRLRKK